MPVAKYRERHVIARVNLCISTVAKKLLTFQKTIALQLFLF